MCGDVCDLGGVDDVDDVAVDDVDDVCRDVGSGVDVDVNDPGGDKVQSRLNLTVD